MAFQLRRENKNSGTVVVILAMATVATIVALLVYAVTRPQTPSGAPMYSDSNGTGG